MKTVYMSDLYTSFPKCILIMGLLCSATTGEGTKNLLKKEFPVLVFAVLSTVSDAFNTSEGMSEWNDRMHE